MKRKKENKGAMPEKFTIRSDLAHLRWIKTNGATEIFRTNGYKDLKEAIREVGDGKIIDGHRIVSTMYEELGGKFQKYVRHDDVQYLWDEKTQSWKPMTEQDISKCAKIDETLETYTSKKLNSLKWVAIAAFVVVICAAIYWMVK